jgi:hypothetical protein
VKTENAGLVRKIKKLSPIMLVCESKKGQELNMTNRFKSILRPLFYPRGYIDQYGEVKIENRRHIASILAGLILLLTLVSASYAEDHKTRMINFLSSGLRTASTAQSSAFDVSAYSEGQIFIDVTAEGSVSTLDITIQTSPDNLTWYTHTTVGQITATGQTRQAVTNFGNYMRIYYTVGGSSFTFSIVGVFKN